jgi:threonine dehydrogenase-like Zn-dependent dehydrogenase
MEQMCERVVSYEAGFAEYAVYAEACLYALPDDVSLEIGAMLEPVTIALHAVDRGDIIPGKTVAVSGAGTIGLLIQQIAMRAGAAGVLAIDPMVEKRRTAARLGADWTADPFAEDAVALGMACTEGRGFDVVFEASGEASAAVQCLRLAGKYGTVVFVGIGADCPDAAFDPFTLLVNELTLRGSLLAPYVYPRALSLLPKLELQEMITQVVPLEDLGQALAGRKAGTDIKILVSP